MQLIEYAKCSTCKKAKKWLDAKEISYEERPIREENPSVSATNIFTPDKTTSDAVVTVKHKEENDSLADGTDSTNIQNTQISSLPSTGGMGTTIFTIGGCIIMITAAGLFFASRRKTSAK